MSLTYEEATARLTADEYSKLLSSIGLKDISLVSLTVSSNVSQDDKLVGLSCKVGSNCELGLVDSTGPTILFHYNIVGKSKKKTIVTIKATIRLQLVADSLILEEFYVIYSRASAEMQIYPYLRELVASITGRMEIPRMTLPIFRSGSSQNQKE